MLLVEDANSNPKDLKRIVPKYVHLGQFFDHLRNKY